MLLVAFDEGPPCNRNRTILSKTKLLCASVFVANLFREICKFIYPTLPVFTVLSGVYVRRSEGRSLNHTGIASKHAQVR